MSLFSTNEQCSLYTFLVITFVFGNFLDIPLLFRHLKLDLDKGH